MQGENGLRRALHTFGVAGLGGEGEERRRGHEEEEEDGNEGGGGSHWNTARNDGLEWPPEGRGGGGERKKKRDRAEEERGQRLEWPLLYLVSRNKAAPCWQCDVGGVVGDLVCMPFSSSPLRGDREMIIRCMGVAFDGWNLTDGVRGMGRRVRRAVDVWGFGKMLLSLLGRCMEWEYLGPGTC
jgi:hypothetical protein